jgi:hypothetical protein
MPLPPSGRRPRTGPVNSGVMGTVYTVHFARPVATSAPRAHWPRHYTGWASDLGARLAAHEAGNGSVLFRLAAQQGTGWRLACSEPGDRNRERQLKQSKRSEPVPGMPER